MGGRSGREGRSLAGTSAAFGSTTVVGKATIERESKVVAPWPKGVWMATGADSGPIHSSATRRSEYRYLFSSKHHGHGGSDAAQWLPTLSPDAEFSVFDTADFHGVSDEGGSLYGVLIENREVSSLGTQDQQIAKFPSARPGEPWHGYPLWPLKQKSPPDRRGEKQRPPKDVFLKMVTTGLLPARDRKRLWKGKLS